MSWTSGEILDRLLKVIHLIFSNKFGQIWVKIQIEYTLHGVMKYECELIIDLPRDRVIEMFDNPDNLSKW